MHNPINARPAIVKTNDSITYLKLSNHLCPGFVYSQAKNKPEITAVNVNVNANDSITFTYFQEISFPLVYRRKSIFLQI